MKDPTQKAHFYRNTLREVLPFIPRVSELFFISVCVCVCVVRPFDANHYHKKYYPSPPHFFTINIVGIPRGIYHQAVFSSLGVNELVVRKGVNEQHIEMWNK